MQANTNLAGIEIGGTKLQLCIARDTGNIVQWLRYGIHANEGAETIRKQILNGLRELKEFESAGTIGIGFGGPVDSKTGVIKTSHQVSGWRDFPIVEWLQKETGKKVIVDNDANVAAFGEAIQGAGKDFSRVFYMTIGSGIGGGFIIEGKIYHGRTPGEMEIGHIRLNKEGTTLEAACSGWAVDEIVRSFISKNPESLLAKLSVNHSGPYAHLLAPGLDQNDKDAGFIVSTVADNLALGLSHVIHLLHPDIIVLGGGLSLIGKHLLVPLQTQLPKYVMDAFHPLPPIEISKLGEQAVPIGAIELAKTIGETEYKNASIK